MLNGLVKISNLKELYDRGYEIDAFVIAAFNNGFDVFLDEAHDDIFAMYAPKSSRS